QGPGGRRPGRPGDRRPRAGAAGRRATRGAARDQRHRAIRRRGRRPARARPRPPCGWEGARPAARPRPPRHRPGLDRGAPPDPRRRLPGPDRAVVARRRGGGRGRAGRGRARQPGVRTRRTLPDPTDELRYHVRRSRPMTALTTPSAPSPTAPSERGPIASFLRESFIVFRRQLRMNLRNPAWVIIGAIQPVLYLLLFGPLLEPLVAEFGFANAYTFFVPGMLVQLGLFGA